MERIDRKGHALLLGLVLVAGAAMTLVLTAHMTFYQDTWAFLINRRDPSAFNLLHPHNEHIVVFPVLIEELLLRVFGMGTALPEYVLLTVFLVTTAALLYVYLSRRVGQWLALFGAIVVLCLGPAWEVLLWPFEITFIGPIMFGLAMLLALERGDRRGDIAGCAFLVLALGFSGLGIAFIAGAAVVVAMGPRETWLRRSYIFLVPLVLYGIWWLGWGHDAESHITLRNIFASPRFILDSVANSVGSLFGLSVNPYGGTLDPASWGRALAVVLVVVLAYRALRKPRPQINPGLWPIAAIALANWFLTAFNAFPGRDPTSSRYQYAGVIFVLMIVSNLFEGVRPSRGVLIACAVATGLAVGPNLAVLSTGKGILEEQSVFTKSDTAAIEIASRTVGPDFQLSADIAGTPSLINIYAEPYLEAVEEYGSPAYTPEELETAPVEGQRQADIVLSHALSLQTAVDAGGFRSGAGRNGCTPVGAEGVDEVELAIGTTEIEVAPGPPANFSLRRFTPDDFPVTTGGAPGNSATTLTIPRDNATQPWHLQVEAEQLAWVCSPGS